jgi:raffinose/stachyose/melibiose transport system permease protein
MMIIYIAGIQNIPTEMQEVASIDGAGYWQSLSHIVIPLLRPAIAICTFLTLTNSFKMFDQNYALTGGAPGKESAMLALDIYSTFYGSVGSEGVGQAKAVVFFVMVAIIAALQLKLTSDKEDL